MRVTWIDNAMRNWIDWPPPSFEEAEQSPGFSFTASYAACKELFEYMVGKDTPTEEKEPRGLILTGSHSRGKTLAALILMRELSQYSTELFAYDFGKLVRFGKKGIEGAEKLERIYKSMEESKFVFIDEVGRSTSMGNKDIAVEIIERICEICYRRRYMVLTSNLTREELSKYFTSYIVSRFGKNSGYCKTIEDLSEESLRCSGIKIKPKGVAL